MPVFEIHLQTSFPEQSVKNVLDQFVQMVEEMDSTVLVPSRLIDISAKDIAKSGEFPLKDIDLRTVYSTLKILSLELKQGLHYLQKTEDVLGLNDLQENLKVFLDQIKQLTACAKYLTERYQHVVNNANYKEVPVQDVNKIKGYQKNSENGGLIEALCQFVEQVEEMEREILFPCLLQDIATSELSDLSSLIEIFETPTAYDLFLQIKTIKKQLLCGLEKQKHNEFCSLMKSIFYTVQNCTALASSVTERYQQEIEGF